MQLVQEYKVSELVSQIKSFLETAFYYVKVIGEISSLKISSSGHIYFNLKDETALINTVLFKNSINNNLPKLEDGIEIVVYGRLTIYKDRSNYQIIAENIEINGTGSLLKLFEERKQKLKLEGLFENKKPIPKSIKNVGIITSPNGAAIKDIESRLRDRMPINVILYPSLVQGQIADISIAKGIEYFNKSELMDVIVITRGGGSFEDLMCFNSEMLARKIYESKIPTITAIGHEIDWTIADYVSDLRLPTPTAVAEFLSPLISVFISNIDSVFRKILRLCHRKISDFYKQIEKIYSDILLVIGRNYYDKLIAFKQNHLRLNKFNRKKILKQGYGIVRKDGFILNKNTVIKQGDILDIELYDRKLKVSVVSGGYSDV